MISEYLCNRQYLESMVPKYAAEKKLYLFLNSQNQENWKFSNHVLTALSFISVVPKELRSITVSYKKAEQLADKIKKVGKELDILYIQKHLDILQYMSIETVIFLKERIQKLPRGIYEKTASDFLQSYVDKWYGHVPEYNTKAIPVVLTAAVLLGLSWENKDCILTLNKAAKSCRLNSQYSDMFWKPFYKKEEVYLALIVYWHCMEDCYQQIKEALQITSKENIYIPKWSSSIKVDIFPKIVYDKNISFEIYLGNL